MMYVSIYLAVGVVVVTLGIMRIGFSVFFQRIEEAIYKAMGPYNFTSKNVVYLAVASALIVSVLIFPLTLVRTAIKYLGGKR